jgi:hypothetical protein
MDNQATVRQSCSPLLKPLRWASKSWETTQRMPAAKNPFGDFPAFR